MDLAAERCRNHPEREAAARCTGCRRHFCRECVTEHAGRMLCAACLERGRAARPAAPPRRIARGIRRAAGRGLRLVGGTLAAWAFFYGLGQVFALWPDATHAVQSGVAAGTSQPAPPEPAGETPSPQ